MEKLSLLKQHKLSMDELCDYKRELRKELAYSDKKMKGVTARKVIHPIINFLIMTRRFELDQDLIIYGDVPENKEKRPIIFSVTHTGKFDIELVNEAIEKPYYLLSDDEEFMYRTIDGYFTYFNGVIYVDCDHKEDMHVAKLTMEKVLNQGGNIMWYPEGVWNLSYNKPVLYFKYGIIDSAMKTNALILPIAIDQNENQFSVNIGDFIDYKNLPVAKEDTKENKIESANILRDEMATLKYELWEKKGIFRRSEIPINYYNDFEDEKLAEWPFITRQTVHSREFIPNGVDSWEDVLADPIIRSRKKQ